MCACVCECVRACVCWSIMIVVRLVCSKYVCFLAPAKLVVDIVPPENSLKWLFVFSRFASLLPFRLVETDSFVALLLPNTILDGRTF